MKRKWKEEEEEEEEEEGGEKENGDSKSWDARDNGFEIHSIWLQSQNGNHKGPHPLLSLVNSFFSK